MSVRGIAVVLSTVSFAVLSQPASAQAPTAPAHVGKPKKHHATTAAEPSAKTAAAPAPILGGETEASSLERRRKAFFAKQPDEGASGTEAPAAGVTLGGSGGLSPGMGFKF